MADYDIDFERHPRRQLNAQSTTTANLHRLRHAGMQVQQRTLNVQIASYTHQRFRRAWRQR